MSETGEDSPARTPVGRAIIELVGTRGYEATSVEMIVAEAGVSREDFDVAFDGKYDCFFQVFEALRQEYLELNAAAFATGEDWRGSLRKTAYAAVDWFQEDPPRARFMALESLNAGDRGSALIDSTLELLAELIHAGRFELEDPDSVPRSAAESAVGSIWNMLASRIRNGDLGDGKEVVPQFMFFAVMPYKGVEVAREELTMPRPG
jgi:AcrR family transcriptional regulator